MGVMLDGNTVTEEDLSLAIQEVLSNCTYKENAKATQYLINDNMGDPKEKFLYWVDYIIRHKGAKHLINHNEHKMSFLEFWSLDVFFFMILVFSLSLSFILYACHFVVKIILRFLFIQCAEFKIKKIDWDLFCTQNPIDTNILS